MKLSAAIKNTNVSSKPAAKAKTVKAVKPVKNAKSEKTVAKVIKKEIAPKVTKKVTKPVKEVSTVTPLSSAITHFRGEHLRTEPEHSRVLTRGRRVVGEMVKTVFDGIRTHSDDTELKVFKGGVVKISTVVLFQSEDSPKATKAKLLKAANECSNEDAEFEFDASEFEMDDDGNVSAVITAKVTGVSDVVRAIARG